MVMELSPIFAESVMLILPKALSSHQELLSAETVFPLQLIV